MHWKALNPDVRSVFTLASAVSLSSPSAESPGSRDRVRRQRHGCEWVKLCQVLRSVLICCGSKYQKWLSQRVQIIPSLFFPPFHLVKKGGVAKGSVRKGQYGEPPSQGCVGSESPGVTSVTHMCPTWWAMCAAAGLCKKTLHAWKNVDLLTWQYGWGGWAPSAGEGAGAPGAELWRGFSAPQS